jgi:ribosomal-protein-alanine N-acetyltransferase
MNERRLRFEPLRVAHAELLLAYEVRNREHLAPWEPARSAAFFTLDAQRESLQRSEELSAKGLRARFAVFERGGSEIVAVVNLNDIRRGVIEEAILGYSVDAAHVGRGYATEAAGWAVAHAFGAMGLHRVHASYQPTNVASGRVLRKLGFAIEGYARDYLYINGAWTDSILTAKINDAWVPAP